MKSVIAAVLILSASSAFAGKLSCRMTSQVGANPQVVQINSGSDTGTNDCASMDTLTITDPTGKFGYEAVCENNSMVEIAAGDRASEITSVTRGGSTVELLESRLQTSLVVECSIQ